MAADDHLRIGIDWAALADHRCISAHHDKSAHLWRPGFDRALHWRDPAMDRPAACAGSRARRAPLGPVAAHVDRRTGAWSDGERCAPGGTDHGVWRRAAHHRSRLCALSRAALGESAAGCDLARTSASNRSKRCSRFVVLLQQSFAPSAIRSPRRSSTFDKIAPLCGFSWLNAINSIGNDTLETHGGYIGIGKKHGPEEDVFHQGSWQAQGAAY